MQKRVLSPLHTTVILEKRSSAVTPPVMLSML